MKDLELKLVDKIKIVKELVERYLDGTKLLKDYINNPIETAVSINSGFEGTFGESFKDVITGLNGEFTKNKAIEIGKQKILNYIISIKEEIDKNYLDLEDVIKEPLRIIYDNYNIIMDTTDNGTLKVRKNSYLTNKLTIQYMERRLVGTLEPIVANYSSEISIKDYLIKLLELTKLIREIEFTELEQAHLVYVNKKTYLNTMSNKAISVVKDEVIKPAVTIKEVNTSEIMTNLLNRIKCVDLYENELDVLSTIIEELPITINTLKEKIEELNNKLNVYSKEKSDTISYLSNLAEKAIVPYENSEITETDYVEHIENYSGLINNSLVIDNDFITTIANISLELNISLNIYMVIHSIVDKTTLSGTIGKTIKLPE